MQSIGHSLGGLHQPSEHVLRLVASNGRFRGREVRRDTGVVKNGCSPAAGVRHDRLVAVSTAGRFVFGAAVIIEFSPLAAL